MPSIGSATLNGLLTTPLVLGVLAALLAILLLLAFLRQGVARRLLTPVAVLAIAGIGVTAILDRMAEADRSAERRALSQRYAELTAQTLAPGSSLACLNGTAGEAVENACEKMVFAGPQSTAAAVAFMAARLTLLSDGLAFARGGDPDYAATLAGLRRAIELDRFGLAAHVLAVRDGCTAERCPAFALLHDANAIKSNLKAQIFDQYVSRYAGNWDKPEPMAPVAAQQPTAIAPVAGLSEAPAKAPVPDKYDFPSADSIPAVSIMNAEPKLPKDATDAQAAAPNPGEGDVPVPPKRPQAQAATPPAR
jgi:hypothetical protein